MRWLSPENVLGEPIYAGRSLGTYRSPRWVRDGDVLTGPLWATWDPSGPPGDARTYIRMASYRPGETEAACESTPELPVAVDPDQAPLIMWNSFPAEAGAEGVEPAALGATGATAFAHFVPSSCAPPYGVAGASVLATVADVCASAVVDVSWSADRCRPDPLDFGVATLWALELGDGRVGLLYRSRSLDMPTRWTRLGVEVIAPRTVGRLSHGTEAGGGQPRGALAGTRVVFSERETHQAHCQLLRSFELDGTDVRDTPWQLPCWRTRVNRDFVDMPARLHPFLELHAVTEAAALVFVDGPNFRLDDPDQSVGIVALALNAEGRRATALVDLAPAEAAPVAFVRTTSAGDELAAAFFDEVPGRDGYWLRRFAYVPDPR